MKYIIRRKCKIIKESDSYRVSRKYRIIEGYGPHFEKRYEVQESYKYYSDDGWVNSWHMIFHSSKLSNCKVVINRCFQERKKREPLVTISEALELWNN